MHNFLKTREKNTNQSVSEKVGCESRTPGEKEITLLTNKIALPHLKIRAVNLEGLDNLGPNPYMNGA